uniref:Signal peptidase I n=1 Tax=Candidatus Kentrum sp. MB TaxID=2138164 RepID=A0A451BG82_9GAMM|nr:MAG: signal peptidase I Serine peptidase. MEROPS family S26A [Candidatus Kentron sp. MB]VFK32748.1 MAG: signal peptidase I Serine peptidase. MEROPS family S26A [Candidatus Kentron sp. MB]VFK77305.1 MAG: signal peptidase I Serine peptidase. MEROPS family S26A [Candidatus Kentron sp. MB]
MRFDFATILVLLVLISGAIWAFDAMVLSRRRPIDWIDEAPPKKGKGLMAKVVDYARSFFPVFLIVLLLRSFLVEPFRIPSGSMLPTLEIGDFILVNKFTFGIRLPILNEKIVDLSQPERGDVVVFRFPEDGVTPYIKRVVGLPGDYVDYRHDTLFINGNSVRREFVSTYTATGPNRRMNGAGRYLEYLDGADHHILIQPIPMGMLQEKPDYPYTPFRIPEGHYFVIGDNRDNSRDSRYWGTVPDENLIGKAFFIWMNFQWGEGVNWARIGDKIR